MGSCLGRYSGVVDTLWLLVRQASVQFVHRARTSSVGGGQADFELVLVVVLCLRYAGKGSYGMSRIGNTNAVQTEHTSIFHTNATTCKMYAL